MPQDKTESLLTLGTEERNPDTEGDVKQRVLTVTLGGVEYTLTFSEEQWIRIGTIIRPKPVPGETDAALILADHQQSVQNVGMIVLNDILRTLEVHDGRKLHQTPEQHHAEEPHHWPLDGYETRNGFLPVQYVVEAICDYIATVFGRAIAGRPLDWLSPTNNITASDVVTSTFLAFLCENDLCSIDPELPKTEGSK